MEHGDFYCDCPFCNAKISAPAELKNTLADCPVCKRNIMLIDRTNSKATQKITAPPPPVFDSGTKNSDVYKNVENSLREKISKSFGSLCQKMNNKKFALYIISALCVISVIIQAVAAVNNIVFMRQSSEKMEKFFSSYDESLAAQMDIFFSEYSEGLAKQKQKKAIEDITSAYELDMEELKRKNKTMEAQAALAERLTIFKASSVGDPAQIAKELNDYIGKQVVIYDKKNDRLKIQGNLQMEIKEIYINSIEKKGRLVSAELEITEDLIEDSRIEYEEAKRKSDINPRKLQLLHSKYLEAKELYELQLGILKMEQKAEMDKELYKAKNSALDAKKRLRDAQERMVFGNY